VEQLPMVERLEHRIEALRRNQLDEGDYEFIRLAGMTEAEFIVEWLAKEAATLRWRRQRQSPPRCLECGSTNLAQIPRLYDGEGMEYFIHPVCEGKLVRTGCMFGRQDFFPLYDPEGNRLTD
jgi:hypothetical protein